VIPHRSHALILAAAVAVAAAVAAAPAASQIAEDGAGQAGLPTHPSELAPLTPQSQFPRFTAAELASAGYPDNLHTYAFGPFEAMRDPAGEPYGPFSLVRGRAVLANDEVVSEPGRLFYRGLELHFDPGYQDWQMLPMIEMLDWARRDLSRLLGHDRTDTLRVLNPDNLDEYRARTGYAFHRLYQVQGDTVVVEPVPVLIARGLAPHAAHHLVAVWLLEDLAGGRPLPAWLVQGLGWYLGQNGTHFLNYLYMYRDQMPVVVAPAVVEAVLTGAPDPDDETDKVRYRTAGYSAFLMAWELVEHRGGLAPVRTFFARVGAGEDPDAVSRELWGADLAGLAAELDPTTRPEPVGTAVSPRTPHRPPAE